MNVLKTILCIGIFLLSLPASAQTIVRSGAVPDRSPSPPGATIEFREVRDGDVVPKTLRVKFEVTGMKVRRAGNPEPDSGHYHLLVDERKLPPLDEPLPHREGIYHFDKGEKAAVVNMPPGEHTLQLIFADYNHVPHDPPVMTEKITVIVEEDTD